jgi:hypothetical protein
MEFFQGQRRKLEIADWQPLRNEQDEKRIRFDLLMPLTGQPYLSMPTFLAPAYEQMEVEGSAIKDTDILTQIDDVTLELYATDQSGPLEVEWGIGLDEAEADARDRKRKLLLTRCTLRNFKLLRVKRGEDNLVAVKFSVTTRSTRGLAAWAHDYNGKTLWCEFSIDASPGQTTIPQTELPLKGSELVAGQSTIMPKVTVDVPMPKGAATPKKAERKLCPFPLCVGDLDHDGDHEDAMGNKLTAERVQ